MKRYYGCLVNAYDNRVGHFQYPKDYVAPTNMEEALIMMDRGEKLTLTDGPFPDYALGCFTEIISQDLKDLFDRYEDSKHIEYLPVLTTSAEYGDRMYYIPKLPHERNIINLEESKYLEAQDIDGHHFDLQVLVPCFYYDKVKYKDIFTTRPYGFIDIVVSSRVMNSIRKEKFNKGLSFAPFYAK